ncbi:MAG TPA: calcineurin-like phosphoesterase family protein [bacterium]|nr:calcineurin-like phosphoesterase family protein [bacterium]
MSAFGFFAHLGALALIVAPVAAQDVTARGAVFHDRNGDGVRDAGEPGLADVGVSNGREIVHTDEQGRYRIGLDDDDIVFVLKPRGWRTPVDEDRIPRFFYIHKPAGSPASEYPGVAPTGPLPKSVDFPLTPQEEPERFEILLFGDPQPRDQKEIDYLAHTVVEPLLGSDAAFGVTLGDILYDDLSLFGSINRTIALIGIPWYNVLGNHDINFDAEDDARSDETFESVYGPSYYSFDYGPVHFLVLDDVHWKGRVTDSEAHVGRNYTGGLGEDQLEFIRRDLEAIPDDQLVVLFMHIPLIAPWVEPERERLYRMLEKRPLAMSVSAHYHYQEHLWLTEKDGWRGAEPHHHVIAVTTCGSWWRGVPDEQGIPVTTMRDGAPHGWLSMTFDGSEYVMDYHAAREPGNQQMHVWAPESFARRQAHVTELLVNVYNGSERSRVEFRLDGAGDWSPLTQTARPDPYYEEAKGRETESLPREWKLPGAIPSPHLWSAHFPRGLEAGQHRLDVRTTDPWGRTFETSRSFRVDDR